MKEIVEILLRYLRLQDLDPHYLLTAFLLRITYLGLISTLSGPILIIGAVIILRGLLNVAIFEGFNFGLLIFLILCVLILVLFLVVLVVLVDSESSPPSNVTLVHVFIQMLIILVLHIVTLIVVLLLVLKLILLIIVLLLILSALPLTPFATAPHVILRLQQLLSGCEDLSIHVDSDLSLLRVKEWPIPVYLSDQVLDLRLVQLLSRAALQLLLDLPEIFLRDTIAAFRSLRGREVML